MSVVQELGTGRSVWRELVVVLFALACLLVGVVAVVGLAADRADVASARAAPVCASPAAAHGCLRPVRGHVTGARSGYRGLGVRYHFVPDRPGVDDAFVRFSGDSGSRDLPPGLAAIVTGRPVTALYWDGEAVAFDAAGQRVWTIGYEPGGWTGRLWVGVLFLALGAVAMMGPRAHRGPVAASLGLGLVGLMVGSLVAVALPTLTAQVVEVVVMVLVFLGLGRWARARAARAAGRDRAPVHHVGG